MRPLLIRHRYCTLLSAPTQFYLTVRSCLFFNPLSLSLFKAGVRVGMTKDIYLSDSVAYVCLYTLSVLKNDREYTLALPR